MNYNYLVKKELSNKILEKNVLIPNTLARSCFSTSLNKFQWLLFFYSLYHLQNNYNELAIFSLKDFVIDTNYKNFKNLYNKVIGKYDKKRGNVSFLKYSIEYLSKLSLFSISKDFDFAKGTMVFQNIFSYIKFTNGVFEIKFIKEIMPTFLSITQKYTFNELNLLVSLKSNFSIIMYMQFKSLYHPANFSNYHIFSIEKIKILNNIALNQYLQTNDLKKRVINVFTNDINQYCDEFHLSYTDIKEGKKIIAFKFHIQPKAQAISQQQSPLNIKDLNFDLPYPIFFKKLYQRPYFLSEQQILEPYLEKINNNIINYLIYQISLKQPHFAINYLTKILDNVLQANLATNFKAIQTQYNPILKKFIGGK